MDDDERWHAGYVEEMENQFFGVDDEIWHAGYVEEMENQLFGVDDERLHAGYVEEMENKLLGVDDDRCHEEFVEETMNLEIDTNLDIDAEHEEEGDSNRSVVAEKKDCAVVPSCSSHDDSHSMKNAACVEVNQVPSPPKPVYYWSDDKIDDGEFEGYPLLTVEQTIRLGKVMVIMVCQGPIHRVEEIVSVLALNLRDPEYEAVHLFPMVEGGDPQASGTALYDIASTTTIQELEKLCEVHKYCVEKEQDEVKGAKSSKCYSSRNAIKKFFCQMNNNMVYESKAALFSFLAASLVKSGVKNREAMGKLWSRAFDKYSDFYDYYPFSTLPRLSRRAYSMLNKAYRPGTKLLKTVLRAFLKKMTEGVSRTTLHTLDFTLLNHTMFNGMKMVTLTSQAFRMIGLEKVNEFRFFESEENKPGIDAMTSFFTMYDERPKYLPWCRLFDENYWSNMTPKAHPSLAAVMMSALGRSDQDIWKMKSVNATEVLKAKCKEMVEKIERTHQKDLMKNFYSSKEKMEAFMKVMERIESLNKPTEK